MISQIQLEMYRKYVRFLGAIGHELKENTHGRRDMELRHIQDFPWTFGNHLFDAANIMEDMIQELQQIEYQRQDKK